MMRRRDFSKSSLSGGVSLVCLPRLAAAAEDAAKDKGAELRYRLSRDTPTRHYDGRTCWCHPRAGIVPGAGTNGLPRVVMTMNTLDVAGSDVFKAVYSMRTDDLGKTWTEPQEVAGLARHETIDGQQRPVAVSDAWPRWHAATKTLLLTGHTVVYTPDWKVAHPRPRRTAYAVYDPADRHLGALAEDGDARRREVRQRGGRLRPAIRPAGRFHLAADLLQPAGQEFMRNGHAMRV